MDRRAEAEAQTYGDDCEDGTKFTFIWNKRTCWGKTLHQKVHDGDEEGVKAILDEDPNDPSKEGADISKAFVRSQFAWIVPFKGQDQLCTGEAIHLAAGRGHVALLQLLIEKKASLRSQVTREKKLNYGVLQAAIFRGGSGGSRTMIEMLCREYGEDISISNINGDTALHLAFSTGNEETIQAVDDLMRTESGYRIGDTLRDKSPLEIGIQAGMMNREALARMAHHSIISGMLKKGLEPSMAQFTSKSACYMASLKLFIHRAPECIPSFLEHWGKKEELAEALWPEERQGKNLPESQRLTSVGAGEDLQKMLRYCPGAGKALMERCTFRPPDRSDGYNKLPERVSLAPRGLPCQILGLSPFCFRFKCFYETDAQWKEDRPWHSELKGELHPSGFWLFDLLNGSCRNGPEEMKDIKIQLCRVPDIITPGFFSSILDARDGDKPALDLFQSLPVRAAVSFTFWKGAVWMDLLQFIFSLWGLILLFIVTWHAQETEYCPEGQANNNATALFNSTREQNLAAEECRRELASVFASSLVIDISGEEQRHERAVVADWIIAKGIVDLLLEGLQFAGCVATNQTRCYFRFGNLWDIIRSILPILLLPYYSCRLLQILVVLMYWMRLLEGATLTQKIGHALLPLQNLIRGLFPAMLFTIIGFGALTHALYAVHNQNEKGQFQRLWPGAVWTTFTRLIVGELDDDPLKDNMELLVLLFGVLFFSVFMMNVFIGVINDQYSEEMKTVRLSFQSLRTKSCLTHLLRMSVIPCDWLRAVPAAGVSVVCVIVCLALQILALVGKGFQAPGCWQFFIFLFLQFVTFMASFQCKGCDFPWLTFLRGNSKTRYLWICEPRDYGEMDADDNEVKPNTTCAEPACISMTRVQTNGGDGRATYPGTYPPTYTSSSAPLASAPLASAPLALPPNPTLLTPCRRRPADVIVCSPKEHAEKCCGL